MKARHLIIACILCAAAGAQTTHQTARASTGVTCLACHSKLASALKERYVHPAVAEGCEVCHRIHSEAPGNAGPFLKQAEPGLCLGCHPSTEKLQAAHQDQPFENARCTNCHDPHASQSPKLIYENAHGPFAGRHCDECHGEAENGKVRLNAARINDLCFSCHTNLKNRIATAKSQHAAIESATCTGCHSPHASPYEHHLLKPLPELCVDCHKAVLSGQIRGHTPEAHCLRCHDPHTGARTGSE